MVQCLNVLSENPDDLSSIFYLLIVEVENQSWQVLLRPPQAYGDKGVFAHAHTHVNAHMRACAHTQRNLF